MVNKKIDVKDYEDETGIPIPNINMRQNLKAALGTSNASALWDKITKILRDNGGLEIVKRRASRNRYSMVPSTK